MKLPQFPDDPELQALCEPQYFDDPYLNIMANLLLSDLTRRPTPPSVAARPPALIDLRRMTALGGRQ